MNTDNTAERTPGPWKVEFNDIVVSGNGEVIVTARDIYEFANYEANMAFIVRACNNHDTNVELLERVLNYIDVNTRIGKEIKTAIANSNQ